MGILASSLLWLIMGHAGFTSSTVVQEERTRPHRIARVLGSWIGRCFDASGVQNSSGLYPKP